MAGEDYLRTGSAIAPRGGLQITFVKWLAIYSCLTALSIFLNYPGRLNNDSYDMLIQAQYPDVLNNWHSPFVTWFWSLLSPPVKQPAGALIMQCLLLFPYPAALLADPGRSRVIPAILTLGLVGISGMLFKDVTLLAFILCGIGAIEYLDNPTSSWLGWVATTAAVLVRPSNFVILAFLGLVWAFRSSRGWSSIRKSIFVILVSLLCIPLGSLLNVYAFKARDIVPERSLIIFDVAGISTELHENLFDKLPGWPTEKLLAPWECYTPRTWEPFAWGDCSEYTASFEGEVNRVGKTALLSWWVTTVIHHPVAYLKHRALYAYNLLRNMSPIAESAIPAAVNSRGHDISGVQLHGKETRDLFLEYKPAGYVMPFSIAERLPFNKYVGFIALLGCIVTVVRCRTAGSTDRHAAIAAIGVGNFLMLTAFGVSNEGRYMLPTVVCGLLCLELLVEACRPAKQ